MTELREKWLAAGHVEETYGQVFLYWDNDSDEYVVDTYYHKGPDVQLSRMRFMTLKEADDHVESVRDIAAVFLARKVLKLND